MRSLYIGYGNDGETAIASELKAIHKISNNITQFKPGCYMEINNNNLYTRYYDYVYPTISGIEQEVIMENIRNLLEKGVKKRLLSDRPIGCLLSGGLDSSLITALVAKFMDNKTKLKTFSVGLENSVDIVCARKVAKYLDTDHYELILTEKEMIESIDKDIELIETYDTTTIRASTPMYLSLIHI